MLHHTTMFLFVFHSCTTGKTKQNKQVLLFFTLILQEHPGHIRVVTHIHHHEPLLCSETDYITWASFQSLQRFSYCLDMNEKPIDVKNGKICLQND